MESDSSITLIQHGSQEAGEEERPHLQAPQALEVPETVGDGAGQIVVEEEPVHSSGSTRTRPCRERTAVKTESDSPVSPSSS